MTAIFEQYLPAFFAAIVTIALVPLAILMGKRLGFLDQPSARKVHREPIPRTGGPAILGGFLTGVAATLVSAKYAGIEISYNFFQMLLGMLLASGFIAVVGFIDDVRSISSRFKLFTLFFAATVIGGSGASFGTVYLAGQSFVEFQWLAWLATLVWVAGITVSVNFIDGLDGLAAGLVALSAAVLGAFLFVAGETVLAGICISLMGALLGFLVFNRHPAKVFMGDCGSMFIGLAIAALMLMANPKIGSMRAIVLPSLALAVPILDGSFTFFRRHYLQRRSIFAAERGHIHHRLLDRGLRHGHAVWFIYAVSIAAVIIGVVALAFEGVATLAGLAVLAPLMWGAFRFAGSVRTEEMLSALRSKRYLDRMSKQHKASFESLQLEFDKFDSVASWWHGACQAANALNFTSLKVTIHSPGKPRQLAWYTSLEDLNNASQIHATIPVPDSPEHGGEAKAEIGIAVNDSAELAGGRMALFSRLITENSLAQIRVRERMAVGKSRSAVPATNGSSHSLMASQQAHPAPGPFGHLRVAVVHDFLYTYCGAERVVEQLINVFPHCDMFALFDFMPEADRGFLRDKHVTTSIIQKLPYASRKHRAYLPLMPFAVEQLDVSGYDLVISSSYLAAKGVITGPDQLHVCYCHSPVRFAWDLQHQYLREARLGFGPKGLFVRWLLHYLRQWDVRSAMGVDHFIANSRFVSRRIQKVYRRDSKVIHPPVDTEKFALSTKKREDFYLVAGRMVPYKRTEMIVQAFNQMPDRKLVVIGEGPDFAKVKAIAGDNITLLGFQSSEVLVDHMQRAKAFVFAAEEDFGIVPVEALSCGTPVIAFNKGGVTETVLDGKHGLLFDEQSDQCLIEAITRFEAQNDFGQFDPAALHARSLEFSTEQFKKQITAFVADLTNDQSAANRKSNQKEDATPNSASTQPLQHSIEQLTNNN